MKKLLTHSAALVSVCALAIGLTACSGGGRPSEQQVAEAITKDDSVFGSTFADNAPADFVDCFAEVLVKSDLSDGALQAIVDGDTNYQGSQADEDALNGLEDEITKCAVG